MRFSTFKGAKMRFLRVIYVGVLLLSSLLGKGEFHLHGSYDLDKDDKVETLVLNSRLLSAIWVEVSNTSSLDTLWSYSLLNGQKFSDAEVVDINADGYSDLILIPDLFASIGNQGWLYIFLGRAGGFSDTPIIVKDFPLEVTTIRPSNLTLVPGGSPKLGIAFGAPVRFGMLFDLEISDRDISFSNIKKLSAPIINNGYGSVYIGGFVSGASSYIAMISPENNKLKTAIFDVGKNFSLVHSDLMVLNDARYILGADLQSFSSNSSGKAGLLIPFGTDDVYLLSVLNDNGLLSKTSFSGQGVFPIKDSGNIIKILQSRQDADIEESLPVISDYLPSRLEKEVLSDPRAPVQPEAEPLNSIPMDYSRDVTSLPPGESKIFNEGSRQAKEKDNYSSLSPTLGDFLESVKDEIIEIKKSEDKTSVPTVNIEMASVNWADEAGFTQLNLGEYIPDEEKLDSTISPIPNKDEGIATFTKEAQESLRPKVVNSDTSLYVSSRNKIDLYYVLAMTPASDTRDRYVFDGEAPFGVSVNQIPPSGDATHYQHGVSANLANLERGKTFDFAYSLRDVRLDSITTLTMVHDMQTNVVFMSISPTDDSLSQSYQPESFDPQLFEFPDYFFEGFPTSLDMDFTNKLIRFSFNEEQDSTYQGIYLSSTTPSRPSQSLAVFMDDGTLQAVRGEVTVRANGSKKVTTEFDLVGKIEPAVMFSRLIQEMFPEELKVKLLQGASLEEPLFGPSGKLPKITREPRLPDAQPSQSEPEIPIEPKQSNVPAKDEKTDAVKSNLPLEVPSTQKDELMPLVPVLEKTLPDTVPLMADSLKLEQAKDVVFPNKKLKEAKPEESQSEPLETIDLNKNGAIKGE